MEDGQLENAKRPAAQHFGQFLINQMAMALDNGNWHCSEPSAEKVWGQCSQIGIDGGKEEMLLFCCWRERFFVFIHAKWAKKRLKFDFEFRESAFGIDRSFSFEFFSSNNNRGLN